VDGVIIQRNVDEGQTVVSSMNAQTIFTIATDLTRIQLQADIPESEVGNIATNQAVTFTVDAHSRMTFTGVVMQVRMSATTVQNVVTFPVIIEAANPRKQLFPGMTANLAIETGREQDVLKIPSAALRFTPPETATTNAFAATPADTPRPGGPPPGVGGQMRRGGGSGGGAGAGGRIWLVGADGSPELIRVRQKLSDGTFVGVECEQDIEGREVIVGINTSSTAPTPDNNPFAPRIPGPQMRRAVR